MNRKIVLIGAGSVVFTKGLVTDLIQNPGGFKWEIGLVDIDPKALQVAKGLCGKIIKSMEEDVKLSASTDRKDLLPGADYVVTTIGVGGRRAWEQDVFIPRKYGIYQPVGDSVMPGGISRAMRMIPAVLDIAKDIKKYCPDAKFFNYANPMTMICKAVRKATDVKVTGLCHGVFNTQNYLADFAGLNKGKVTTLAAGLNHLTFIYDFRYDGKDAWSVIKEKLKDIKQEDELKEPFAWELFKTYNVFSAPGDRHITEYFAERFPEGKYYGKTLGIDAFSFEKTIENGDMRFEKMTELALSEDPLSDDFIKHSKGEHEQLMDIINSIEHDKRKVFSVNIPNDGIISGLPENAILELPAVATSTGLSGIHADGLPDVLKGHILKHIAIAELAVDAALTGNKRLFVEAIMTGGYITDKSKVEKMTDELLDVHSENLPQF